MNNGKTRKCPHCSAVYDDSLASCPNCLSANPREMKSLFWALFPVFLSVIIFFIYNWTKMELVIDTVKNKGRAPVADVEMQEIPVRPMSELSYLSKDEILKRRVNFVSASKIFGDLDYKPNPAVFQIEDSLPWISAPELVKHGVNNNPNIGKGVSCHSLPINNPELLLNVSVLDYGDSRDSKYASDADYFIPKKVLWVKKENRIKVYFDLAEFLKHNPQYPKTQIDINLAGINARDFGYNWVKCVKQENVFFKTKYNNISQTPYELKDYIHKGFACKLKSGCNNHSPYQEQLDMIISKPAYLMFCLWKNKPLTNFSKPDIIYEMFFE